MTKRVRGEGLAEAILAAVGAGAEIWLTSSDWSSAVAEMMEGLGLATGVSRVHLVRIDERGDEETYCTLIREWTGEGVEPVIGTPEETDFPMIRNGYSRWMEVLARPAPLQGLTRNAPACEQTALESEGIKSFLCVPISVGERWWGWIAFDDTRAERTWEPAELDALRVVAGLIGGSISRDEADLRRRETEDNMRALVEHVPAIFYEETNSDEAFGDVRYVSPQVESILGVTPEHWLRDEPFPWYTMLHPNDRDRATAAAERANAERIPFDVEYRLVTPHRGVVWIRDSSVPQKDESGAIVVWQGVMQDITEAKETEQKLKDAESRFRALVEGIPAVTYIDDLDMVPQYLSPQVEDMLGYPLSEWEERPHLWDEILHPDDRGRVTINLAEGLPESRYSDEYRLLTKDGRWIWIRDDGVVTRDDEGKPGYWLGVMYDITGEKESRQRLGEAESRFRVLVEQIPAVAYIEPLGRPQDAPPLYVSPKSEEITGYPAEEWYADPQLLDRMLHPDDRAAFEAEIERTEATGERFTIDYRILSGRGTWMWIHDEAELAHDQEGNPIYWQGVMYDVTEDRNARDLLHQAEERRRSLVEQLPAIVYTQELGGSVTYMSPRLLEITGITPDDWVADPDTWRRMLHPDDRDRVLSQSDEHMSTLAPYDEEYRLLLPDGRVLWIGDRAVVVRGAEGEPKYWQGVMVDITEKHEARELERELAFERQTSHRLRELDEMKNTFLTAVSHDLRTPLAAILGLALTLEREDIQLNPAETKDLIGRISGNARRLNMLVADLLDLDRLSRGVVEPNRHPTDVAALVLKVLRECELLHDHEVAVDVQPCVISVDGAKVERMVENLLTNTGRHTPGGTHVWISVRSDDGGASILVEDDGPGVPPGMRDAVFEPFRQGDSPGGSHSPGVGVGLSLVARFAELHGGRAWVTEREGGGASFRVFLPGEVEAEASGN